MNRQYQQQFVQAQQLLQQGRVADCLQVCGELLRSAPQETNALHLSAIALQRSGESAKADAAFLRALKTAPKSPELLTSHARFLKEQERTEEAAGSLRKALAFAPDYVPARHALALLLYQTGQLSAAADESAKLTKLAPKSPAAWEVAAAVAQKQGDIATAIALCSEGLSHVPTAPRLHYSLAQLQREDCDFEAAAASYATALEQGFDAPDLYRNRAEALLEAGDASAAAEFAARGVERYPGNALLHRNAANMHFSTQAAGDPLERLRASARREPDNADLWQALVELMKRLGRETEASEALIEARRLGCPDSPGILALEAQDAAYRGDDAGALRRFEALLPRCPENTAVIHSFAQQALASGEPARAEALCADLLSRDPYDQLALAYRGTAWQLLGDDRERWLLDYERMVVPVEVPVPDGFSDRAAFFAALREVLEDLHHTTAQPIEQSVRGGTQTNGFLFRLKHPLLRVLEQQIRLAIISALARFADDSEHPFWGRRLAMGRADALRFAGAWSVRLRDQGFHSNHIHPRGWISSALYISLPDEVQRAEDEQGFIQFGSPMHELRVDLPPRRTVQPVVGTLVLFPSYMWHGTLPFHSDQPRITVAFDLLPQA